MTEPRRHKNDRGHKGHEPLPPGELITPPPASPGEDVNIGLIARFGVGLVLIVVVVSVLLWLFVGQLARQRTRTDPVVPDLARRKGDRQPEGVRLQEQPFLDIDQLRQDEATVLNNYGWVDEKAGLVHIPIDTAMRVFVRRGVPVRAPQGPVSGGATPTVTAVPSPSPTAVATPRPRPRPRLPVTPAATLPPAVEPPPAEPTPDANVPGDGA